MHEPRSEPNVTPAASSAWPSSLERYQSIVQNAAEGIFQSAPNGQFLLVNPALARMYGYESPEYLMQSVQDNSQNLYVDPAIRAGVDLEIDGGELPGTASTVVDLSGEEARIVREGAVSAARIRELLR